MPSVIGKTCPYCQYPVKPGAPTTVCSACGIAHHAECWDHNGGCTTYGCRGTRNVNPGAGARSAPLGVIDLSNIMSEPERLPASTQTTRSAQPVPDQGEAPLVSAAHKVAGASGAIGLVAGFIAGLAGGGIGCIPGAIIGLIVGALVGSILLYLLILGVSAGLGYAIAASGGPDAGIVGLWVGVIVGVVIIAVGCTRKPG